LFFLSLNKSGTPHTPCEKSLKFVREKIGVNTLKKKKNPTSIAMIHQAFLAQYHTKKSYMSEENTFFDQKN